jgi:hypothetical protein
VPAGGGWVSGIFATPVAVAANSNYTVAYHSPNGQYAYTSGGLAAGVSNGPLEALAGTTSGGNGVYRYGASGTVPKQTWNNTNYFVDVVFAN